MQITDSRRGEPLGRLHNQDGERTYVYITSHMFGILPSSVKTLYKQRINATSDTLWRYKIFIEPKRPRKLMGTTTRDRIIGRLNLCNYLLRINWMFDLIYLFPYVE